VAKKKRDWKTRQFEDNLRHGRIVCPVCKRAVRLVRTRGRGHWVHMDDGTPACKRPKTFG
jgi:hypothetical protein